MIVTETQLKNDTEVKTFAVIIESGISKILEKDLYVFISHKHTEEEYVYRLRDILKRYGFEGYVDWEDNGMPPMTSGETAKQIKDRIKKSKKFILIATEAAIESKWCNWEMGFADAHKYIDRIALFPIKADYGEYSGKEYLQIYPTLQISFSNSVRYFNYYIKYPDGKEITLGNWLTL